MKTLVFSPSILNSCSSKVVALLRCYYMELCLPFGKSYSSPTSNRILRPVTLC